MTPSADDHRPAPRRALAEALRAARVADGDRILVAGPCAAPDALAVAVAAGIAGRVVALVPDAARRLAAERRRRRLGFAGLSVVDGEPGRIPLPAGAVDTALVLGLGVPEPAVLAELRRVVRPGGRIVLDGGRCVMLPPIRGGGARAGDPSRGLVVDHRPRAVGHRDRLVLA